MKKRTILFTFMAMMLLLAGCTQQKEEQHEIPAASASAVSESSSVLALQEDAAENNRINVAELWEKYNSDPDSHTPTYNGAQESAAGVITYIGKDDHGTDSMELSDKENGKSYVLGVFGSAEEMASVSVGDTVTITGNFHIMSSGGMVVLKQCSIVDVKKNGGY